MKNMQYFRIVVCFSLIVALLFACAMRIFIINDANYSSVQLQNNSYSFKLSKLRGTIFDCNMQPITNKSTKTMAAFLPTEAAVTTAASILEGNTKNSVLSALKKGNPAIAEVNTQIDCFGVRTAEVYINLSPDLIAPQLIGYVDSEGHGVSGIQKAFDDILYSDSLQSMAFATDGLGNLLTGAQITEITDESVINSGIALTIDSNIQAVTLKALKNVRCGAAVVSEIGTGKIRAMVSKPEFDPTNIAAFLNSSDAPLINRALTAYNVGSAFKPCVSAAALENGNFDSFNLNCTGSTQISGHTFHCHNLAGHGSVNFNTATAFSCNSFFYNLSVKLGAEAIYKMASSLNFGNSYDICNNITLTSSLTNIETLRKNERALANLAIGQGELLLSPVAIISLYEAIANSGKYYPQTVVEGEVRNGSLIKNPAPNPTRVMSEKTAEIIKQHLASVIEFGTGTAAKPTLTTAAGKTATAETGWKKDGRLIQNSWFCGFFPLENPKYAVAVLIEDSLGGDDVGAPVFSEIADAITMLKK